MSKTVVLQSYNPNTIPPWMERCLKGVRAWAQAGGYGYEFIGDELFDPVPPDLADKARHHLSTLSDLGRLHWLQSLLAAGADRVVWIDADVLIFAPDQFEIDAPEGYAFGREIWVQPGRTGRGLTVRRNVHNAVMVFDAGNPFLNFYLHAAQRIIGAVQPKSFPAQIVGTKLLTALSNMLGGLPVIEEAGMLSPLVVRDIVAGGGPALELQEAEHGSMLAANLCSSLVGFDYDGDMLTQKTMEQAVERLLEG